MSTLISKLQLANYEKGEFSDIKMRTFDETIELIENFDWVNQRTNVAIELTNPSVTIEGSNGDYLKLAIFFNQKFVLYYFNGYKQLFKKSFKKLNEVFKFIQQFFENKLDILAFHRESLFLKSNTFGHFETNEFVYKLTKLRFLKYLFSTSFIAIGFLFFLIFLLVYKPVNSIIPFMVTVFVGVLLSGFNILLLANYYWYCKKKTLVMSKGNPVFYFGEDSNLKSYNKKDILTCIEINVNASRSTISDFYLFILEMKDGSKIKIPNLLVNEFLFYQKLDGVSFNNKRRIPFVKI